jgi:hypothetical protein
VTFDNKCNVNITNKRIPKGRSKNDNPEKLAT